MEFRTPKILYRKVLKHFYMEKSHLLCTPMVVRSLDIDIDPFEPRKKDEELVGREVPYVSGIVARNYLANCTCPDILYLSICLQDIVLYLHGGIGTLEQS